MLWIRMSSTVCFTVCRLEHLVWEAEALKVFMPGWIFFEFSRVQLTSGAGAFYHNRSLMCFDCPVWLQLLNPRGAWGLAQPLQWSKSITLSVFLIQAIRSVCKSVSWVPFCSFFFFCCYILACPRATAGQRRRGHTRAHPVGTKTTITLFNQHPFI